MVKVRRISSRTSMGGSRPSLGECLWICCARANRGRKSSVRRTASLSCCGAMNELAIRALTTGAPCVPCESDAKGTDFGCWLAMLIGRVCVDVLRFRRSRKARSIDTQLADVSVMGEDPVDPEQEKLIADSVGLALGVVLDTLTPEERLAIVLHDRFGVRFEEIASIVGCSPIAARQITTRARHRIQGSRSFS